MRKRILPTVAILVVVALAFGAGVLMQQRYQLARVDAIKVFARDFVGLDDPLSPAPAWEEWQYPKADCIGSGHDQDLTMGGKLVRPAGHYAVLVTPDAFEDVARFYAEKTGFDDPASVARSHAAISSQGTIQGESSHLLDDSDSAADLAKARPVRAKCLVRRCPSYDLTVFLTRAEGETNTHIVLVYQPKTGMSGGKM